MKKFLFPAFLLILLTIWIIRSDYSHNRFKWFNSHITHYRMDFSIGNYWMDGPEMPVTVEVRYWQIVSMTAADGTKILKTDKDYEYLASYATVNRLFSTIQRASITADTVNVQYDETYGFPVSISIDSNRNMQDDEMSYRVSNFEVLK